MVPEALSASEKLSIARQAPPSGLAVPTVPSGTVTPSNTSILDEKADLEKETIDTDGQSAQNDEKHQVEEGKLEKVLSRVSIAAETSSALRLFFIVVALVLSVFLVRPHGSIRISPHISINIIIILLLNEEHAN